MSDEMYSQAGKGETPSTPKEFRDAPVPVNWVPVGLVPIDALNRVCSF
jgi:hypothetical protein